MTDLPQFLLDLLAAVPKHGDGVHSWLYRVSRQLHVHRSEEDMFALLKASVDGCGRVVPDNEIWDAIRNSQSTAWKPRDGFAHDVPESAPRPRWPDVDPGFRARVLERVRFELCDLVERSPVRVAASEWVLPQLFKDHELVCVGQEKKKAITAPLARFRGGLAHL